MINEASVLNRQDQSEMKNLVDDYLIGRKRAGIAQDRAYLEASMLAPEKIDAARLEADRVYRETTEKLERTYQKAYEKAYEKRQNMTSN